MIISKQDLPDDPAPLDCPPAYDAVPRDEKFHRLCPRLISLPPCLPVPLLPVEDTPGKEKRKHLARGSASYRLILPARTLIRDLVKEQSQNSAASLAILESCADACAGYDLALSALLQLKSIEGHTPMYWAIVKRAPDNDDEEEKEEHAKAGLDLLTALISYATPLNPNTIADIRHACLLTSDQLLFQRLRMSPEFSPLSGTDEMLLGANIPPDAIAVENVPGDEARMWRLEFLIAESSRHRDSPRQGSWCISLALLENSPPTWIDSRLLVPEPPSDTPSSHESSSLPSSPSLMDRLRPRPPKPKPTISIRLRSSQQLVPPPRTRGYISAIVVPLDDSTMGSSLQYTGTSYIAPDETLRARLEARLIRSAVDSDCTIC